MIDILHRVGIEGTTEDVFRSLTTINGLAGWWTDDTSGDTAVEGHIVFRFGEDGVEILVLESVPTERVAWQVTRGPDEWVDTLITFDLSQEEEYAIVRFGHRGWREAVPFTYHCSTKWAIFLMSLKSFVETGKGAPAPHDVRISNWH